MPISLETAKALTTRQECEIVRGAVQRNPGSATLRLRLARLLNQLDAFADTIALLTKPETEVLGYQELLVLAAAYLACNTSADSERACDAAERARVLAKTDAERSVALADHAKALFRVGQHDMACDLLTQALLLDPHNRKACKRLAFHLLLSKNAQAVMALTDDLAARGVGHSRLLAARTVALAQLGEIDAARQMINLPEFLHNQRISPPVGWNSLQAFNAALAEELLAHPGMRYNRYGTASEKTWRIDTPAVGAAPAARALLSHIVEAMEQHLAALPDRPHPWLTARPRDGVVQSWCVITDSAGFEDWHVHPSGWMSGGYYVQVPEGMAGRADAGGCLAFGIPDRLAGESAARLFSGPVVRPQAGTLTLFPSHSYHRTFPHGCDGRRICIAFDLMPADVV